MINLDWVQVGNVLTAAVIIIYGVKEIKTYPRAKYWLSGFIFWQALTILFYVLLNLDRLQIVDTPLLFTDISSALRFLGQLTVAGVVVTWHKIHKLQGGNK